MCSTERSAGTGLRLTRAALSVTQEHKRVNVPIAWVRAVDCPVPSSPGQGLGRAPRHPGCCSWASPGSEAWSAGGTGWVRAGCCLQNGLSFRAVELSILARSSVSAQSILASLGRSPWGSQKGAGMGRFSEPCPGCGPQGCARPTRAPCPVAWGRRCGDRDPNRSVSITSARRTRFSFPGPWRCLRERRPVPGIQGKGLSSSDLGDR